MKKKCKLQVKLLTWWLFTGRLVNVFEWKIAFVGGDCKLSFK